MVRIESLNQYCSFLNPLIFTCSPFVCTEAGSVIYRTMESLRLANSVPGTPGTGLPLNHLVRPLACSGLRFIRMVSLLMCLLFWVTSTTATSSVHTERTWGKSPLFQVTFTALLLSEYEAATP